MNRNEFREQAGRFLIDVEKVILNYEELLQDYWEQQWDIDLMHRLGS